MQTDAVSIYARLLRADWARLPEGLRRLHSTVAPEAIRGRFSVRHGPNMFSRVCSRWLNLPREAAECEVALTIEPRGEQELWTRRFGDHILTTTQWAGTDGCVHERFGMLEFTFQLQVEDRMLRHVQRAAALSIGGLRVPLPFWLAPEVRGSEYASVDNSGVEVQVEVRLPVVGVLLAYQGTVDCREGRS